MVKVKKNNRNFEVKKYIKKTTPALMSLLVATSCLNGVHYPKNAYASGVTQKINTGDGGVKVLYANNGLNPLNFSIGDAAIYGHKNVEDVVKISVTFPKNNGQNDYGPESKKVHIKYEFNSNKGAYWAGRPFYWFSLPKNVKEPSNIKITNASGNSDSIQNWRQWATNTRFVASRYQNMQDAIAQNEGHPHDWGRFNDRTEEYQKGFNGSFNYQFNRMLDEQDGGWFDDNGGTRNFAKSIRNNSKSIYIDWEPRGDGKVTIEVETEVMFPLKSNTLDFAAGAFSVLGNIRIANMQTVTTPHYITYAEKYALDTPEIMEVENPNNIGEEKKKEIIKKLKEEPKNKDKTKYLVEENKYDDHKQQIEVKDNGDTTITFRDLSQQTIAGSRLVTKHVPYKDRFGIKIPQATSVKKVDSLDSNEINKVKEAIYEANKDNKDFLEGIGNDKNKITVDKTGKAKIEYKDKTSHEIEANKLVTRYIPLAEKYEPFIYTTTPVKDLSSINETEKKEIIRKLKEINKDNTEFMNNLKDGFDKALTVDKQGNATFKYKDDSEDKIVSSRLVYKALPMNQQFSPVPGNRTAVDDDQNVKEEEKKKILEELKAANKNIFENSKLDKSKGLDNSGVEFDSKGEATFHYADGTTDTISASRLLYKKGGSTTIGTELKTNGQYKYYLTPIKIKSWDELTTKREGLYAQATRRFIFDNYEWQGKKGKYEEDDKNPVLVNGAGKVTNGGWDIWRERFSAKINTANLRIATSGFGDSGISRIVQGASDNLEFQNSNAFNNVKFQIPKNELFYVDNPFDKEKAKKQAEQIIDDLKKKGLSEEDANKLKKELEDKKDTLTQEQVDKTIKEAEQEAKEGKEKQDLDKAKQKAQEEIGNLKDLDNKEKEKLKKEVEQKTTPEDVKKVVDKAREEDSKAKEAKDKKKLLEEAKKKAKEIIKGLKNLETKEKDNFDKQVDSAQDENKINEIVEKAKEQDKANVDKKALDEAKKKAKEIIGKLEHLSNKEKEAYTKTKDGSVDKANTKEDVDKQIKEAQKKDADNKKALDQAKNKAKEDIGKLKHLSPEEREKYNKEIDKAKDQNAINQVINQAKEKDKQNAKSKAISDINNSGLSEEEKKQAKKEIEQAGSTDDIDQKAEQHLKKAAEEKAKKEKEEADKLKEEYKKELNKIKDIDEPTKKELEKRIDNANSKAELDSILQEAKAKAKQKQAKEEIDKLTHLNKKQKEIIKEKIENLISEQDINDEVTKATNLDGKMDVLKKLLDKAKGTEGENRKKESTDQKAKAEFETAKSNAEKVANKETGEDADETKVDELTKALEDAFNKLVPTKEKVKAEVSKEALKKAIEDAKKLKDTDLYKNSDENKRKEFDEKLTAAETENTKQDSTDESVAKALQDLQNAQNALNGTFKLEKENGDALISVSDANDTEIKEDKDKEAIKAKVKGIPDGAVVTYSKIKDKKVTVTVVKDNVSKTIEVPVKGDVAAPTITVDGATPMGVNDYTVEVTKMENFPELTVTAKDDNLDESTLDVKPDVDWLEFDKNTKKIKLKAGEKSIPNTATNATISISVKDKAGNKTAKTIHVTVKSQADKYKPVAKDTVNNKNRGDKAGEAKNYVKLEGNNQFPANTTFKWKENNQTKDDIDLDTPGDNIEKTIEITYPDGSKKEVQVKFNVAKTNLTEPTISEKDNGDIEIQAGPNATSLELTYKDKADKEKTETLTKTKGAWTNLPDGFTANGDKITLSHESTKEGSIIKAKSKADNYNDSNEKTLTRTKTSPKNPTTEVFVKGQAVEGQALSAEDKALVIASLKDENKNGGTPSIEDSAKIRTENGKQVIDVTITHQDGSKSKISVPLKQDGTKPEITITYDTNNKLTKLDKTLPEIKIEASDTNSGINGDVEVTGLPDYLTYDKTTKTIKFANGKTEIPKTAQDFTINVKVKDKVGNEQTKELKVTVQNQSDKYSPETLTSDGTSPVRKYKGQEASKPETYVKDKEKLPSGTTYKWKNETGNPKLDTLGEVEKEIEITYPDDSKETVKVKFKVVEEIKLTKKDESPVLVNEKVEVGKQLQQEANKEKIKAKIEGILADSTVKFGAVKEEKGKKVVPVTVEKDGERKEISIEVKEDTTKPVVSIKNSDKDIITGETLPELKVEVTDENVDNDKVEVTVPSWLNYDKQTNTIKLKAGDKVPNTIADNEKKITVKATDKAGNVETKEITLTIKSQSEKYTPESKLNGSVKKVVGEATDKAENYIKDKDKLPTGTTFKWKENNADTLTLDKVGKDQEKTITVTFPDGSKKEVKVKFNVVDTKPSAPTVAVLKNGDVTITPSDDSDKVVVGYTPKDSDKEKLVEVTKDKGKWKLPEGFKEENGKIIIPDEITKNNTAVRVKASKGTSDYTTEVKQDLTKKSLLAPVPVVISGSDAKDTVLTKENADLIIATLTNAQTGGGVASIADGEKIKEDADGSKYVEVTLTYDDNSKKVIKVKVVGDSTGPVFEGLGDASVKKYETFKPIEIKATDAGSALRDNQPYEVENLPSWLEFDKATNKVKLANALTRVPKEATTVKFKVKAYDKFNNVTEQEVTVTVNEAEEFTFEKPVIIKGKDKDKEKLSPEDEKTILDAVRGTNKLDGAEPSIVDKTIKVSGDESSVDVTLTYDDNQTRVINVKVEQDAKLKFGLHLPSEKVEVNDINNLNQVEKAKVLEKVKLANSDLKEKDGYTYSIVAVTGQDKKAGTVTVSKDGKVVGELPGERLVKERDITKYDVVLPKVKVQVENKTNLKADEKEKVKEALENATDTKGVSNKDKFPKGTTLEVQSDGTVIISYPDKTIKTILGSDLVDGPSPYVKTLAEEITPKVPDEKVKVVNPSSLDDKEIVEVKEKIKQANKDTFPANTTVEVAKDGTATITYKDGSSDTIKNTDLVEKAKEKLTDAKQNPAVKPNAKVEVEDSKKLTDDEKAKVKENVKNTNPKAKDIVVGADGTVEITYPDGSENTIKPEDTVVQKAGKTPKESEAVKNPAKVPAVKVKVADTTKLTAEEIAKVKEEVRKVNPNATKVEVSSNGTATLTYKDGSENIVAGEKLVEQKAKGKTLAETVEILVPDVKTEVINPNRLSTAEKEKVKENLKAKNAGKLDSANITVQNNGTVTVEFADGSAKTIDGEKLVTKKADDGKLKPTIADLTDVDAPIYTKVAEYGKLTDSEKEAVKKAVIEANGGEDGKLKDADIKVLGDGTVVITYKDKSTDIIPADKTVNVGQSGSEALVQPALPEYPLDKLKPVADDFITEETQKIKDEINDSNIYSKEEKQKALAKIDEMVKKAKQKVQNAENDDKVLNTINEVLQDAKEFSKNIKENKLAEIAKAKAEAKAEIDKLANLTDEQKSGFKAEVDKAENLSDVKEVLDKAKVKDKEELVKAKAEAKAEIDKLVNLTDEQKSSFKKEADKAKTKADVKEVLDKAKAKDKEELDKAKAEAKSQIDKLANLTDEQKSSFKKDIQAGKDKNTVAKILDKAKEANKKVKGKAGAKEKAKGQSTLAKTGLNTTNTVGLGAIISLIALALRRKFKK